ncbi:SSI family serine proteinase inhibitor [Streptomyces sp. SR27]|uniref:SSI family serine proteinase inhibitor n=1 Tax=unclassified Streptomyces TaxID=2593676 RepID=UPI00295BABE2|nr:SSI family serine proteinase inhibitor [Streptomyces sp. SR27]MDV9190578.1 SSI family serine proteinase inhibitor [Streptomyces sp. SR27]
MLRSLAIATLATAAAGTAGLGPLPPLPLLSTPDSLTVTISESGYPEADGTFDLTCDDRAGGNHPAAENACKRLEQLATEGGNPFKPVPADQLCTQVYGGPALAHITGTWQGRRIDARFSRANGCEIDRWENLEPVLPLVRG